MRVYISGPITNGDRGNKAKIEAARKTFNSVEAVLRARGHDPVNPFKVVPNGEMMTWAECMKENIIALMSCDGIYMLPGWHESEGALLENTIARKLRMELVK